MKKILVAGAGSYIGESFKKYMEQWPSEYEVFCLNMIGHDWELHDFSQYDVVYQVAGIAHIRETNKNKDLFYQVNRDLAVKVAKKAKSAGVKQFIYLSSMSVYGVDIGIITPLTPLNPQNNYSKSKVQAEERLSCLADNKFLIAILRPPVVYGKGCKGNYNVLEKIALTFPFFPKVNNKRSMLYIDNLSGFVKLAIDNKISGTFFPQNREYVCTYDMAKEIRNANGKKMISAYCLGLIVKLIYRYEKKLSKAFGDLIYQDVECFSYSYCSVSFEESIKKIYQNDGDMR